MQRSNNGQDVPRPFYNPYPEEGKPWPTPPIVQPQINLAICDVYMSVRSETDKQMQKVYCPIAIETDTNTNVRDYPDSVENFCNSCTRKYTPASPALGTRYNYQ